MHIIEIIGDDVGLPNVTFGIAVSNIVSRGVGIWSNRPMLVEIGGVNFRNQKVVTAIIVVHVVLNAIIGKSVFGTHDAIISNCSRLGTNMICKAKSPKSN